MVNLIKILKTIFPLIQLYPWGILAIVILGILASLAEGIGISLLIPFLQNLQSGNSLVINNPIIQNIDQYLINFQPQQRVLLLTSSILVAILIKAVLSYIYTALCSWLQNSTLHRLRTAVYKQLIAVSQSFWDTNKSGELLNLITQETYYSSQALSFLIWVIINLSMIGIFGLLLLLISWRLTLLVAVAFLLISVLIRTLTSKTQALGRKHQQANIYLSNLTLETFTGIKTIRAFGKESYEEQRYYQASKKSCDSSINLAKQSVMIEPISEGLSVAILMCVMLVAFYTQVTLPVLITFIFMLYRLQPQVQKLNSNLTQVIALSNCVKSVFLLLEHEDKPYVISGNVNFHELRKGITFDAVNFLYPSQNKPALENISL
jgi:ABC-type multidrug transport system fused ATPase/permease subunit